MASIVPPPKFQGFDSSGNPLSGGKLYTYAAGTLTPLATSTDSSGGTPNANPVILNTRGEADVWLSPSALYKLVLKDSNDVTIWTVDNVGGTINISDLANTSSATLGSSLIGWLRNAIGAVATTIKALLGWSEVSAFEFMTSAQIADIQARTFTLNVGTALKAFFDHCILTGARGYIPAGGYLITKGVLAFDTAYVDKAWPHIRTDGADLVEFRATASTNSPFMSITNGTASSGTFEGWLGGSLGGITFRDTSGASAASAHGLVLRGMLGTHFGYMRGESLRASLVYIDAKLFGGTNPDPYNVVLCDFDGIDANNCEGFALNNDNYVGFNVNRIAFLRATNCPNSNGGIWRGCGDSIAVSSIIGGANKGWCIDDRTTNTGGSSSRIWIGSTEFDNCEFGIRLNTTTQFEGHGFRVIHRFQTSPNASANYYPRKVVDLCSGSSPSVGRINMSIRQRVEAGGVLADLGTFVDANNQALEDVVIDQNVADEGALGVGDSNLYANINNNGTLLLTNKGRNIIDRRIKVAGYFRGSATGTSFGTLANNPITTVNGSPVAQIAIPSHGMVANQILVIQGVGGAVNNIPQVQLESGRPITAVIDANTVSVTYETNANASSAGGGAAVTAAKDRSFIQQNGYGTMRCKCACATARMDRDAQFSVTTYEYTVPYTGTYKLWAKFFITGLTAGDRIRAGFAANVHTSYSQLTQTEYRCQGANREAIQFSGWAELTAGDKICLVADTSTAAAKAPSISDASDFEWGIEAV